MRKTKNKAGKASKNRFDFSGFTIIELLVVIVVIGILAVTVMISYSGVTKKANVEALKVGTRAVVRAGQLFESSNSGDHKFYFDGGQQINDNGYKLNIGGKVPSSGVVSLFGSSSVSIALHDGTFCAIKNADSDVINITEVSISNCSTYDVIQTCDTWADLALKYDVTLSELIAFNGESDSNSSTCGRNIKIPVKIDISTPALCFVFNSGTGTITDYNYTDPSCPSNVKIPSSIGGVTVTALGASSFASNNLTGVRIPSTVATIGASAFKTNSITSLTVPSTVTSVGDQAFAYNTLTDGVVWNSTVVSAGSDYLSGAFRGSTIGSITFGTNVTRVPTRLLCYAVPTFTSYTFPDHITETGVDSFRNIGLTSVNLNKLITVGGWTFKDNSLTSITIPSSTTIIGEQAFYNNKLTSLTVPSTVTSVGDLSFAYNPLGGGVVWNAAVTSAGGDYASGALKGSTLSSITFGANVTRVPNRLLSYASPTFTSYTFPDHVTESGIDSFRNIGLTSVNLNKLVTVGGWTFKDNSITSISIPSWTTTVGEQAFYGNQLSSLNVPSTTTSIGPLAFAYNPLTGGVTWNPVIASIGDRLNGPFKGSTVGSITFNPSLTRITSFLFCGSTPTFSSYSIPSTITVLGNDSLRNMGLTSVTIPSSVTTIEGWVFKENSLTNITIPNSVTSLGQEALQTNSLTSITIGGGVTIGSSLLTTNDNFRTTYSAGGAGTYTGTQTGVWTKI